MALIILANRELLKLQGATIRDNRAQSGGAIFLTEDSEIIINATTIVVNNSAREGGGCYLSSQSKFILGNEASLRWGFKSQLVHFFMACLLFPFPSVL